METNTETFCQICRHPTPGHHANCPVGTGEPVRGIPESYQQVMQAAQEYQSPLNMMQQMAGLAPAQGLTPQGQGNIPLYDGYEVAKIYREARQRLLEELKMQVEVNHQLGRELIDLRLENQELKNTIEEQHKAITEMSSQTRYTDDSPPF